MHILVALAIGAIAGFLANLFMNNDKGIIVNIILGVLGGIVGDLIFSLVGISASGIIGNIVVSTVGAVLIIFIANKFFK